LESPAPAPLKTLFPATDPTCAVIQKWLGHSNPATTSVYHHLTEKAKAKAIKSINVLMDDLYEAGSDQVKCSSSEGKHVKKATFFVLKWFFWFKKGRFTDVIS